MGPGMWNQSARYEFDADKHLLLGERRVSIEPFKMEAEVGLLFVWRV